MFVSDQLRFDSLPFRENAIYNAHLKAVFGIMNWQRICEGKENVAKRMNMMN